MVNYLEQNNTFGIACEIFINNHWRFLRHTSHCDLYHDQAIKLIQDTRPLVDALNACTLDGQYKLRYIVIEQSDYSPNMTNEIWAREYPLIREIK